MAAKDGTPMTVMTPRRKKEFLKDFELKHKDLGRRQREYKKILSMRLKTRSERILEKSYVKTIARLQSERNDLRAQIWVANGRSHMEKNKNNLKQIKCHINCQEHLAEQIKNLKVLINNMEREMSRVNKHIYELNRKTVPDSQYQDYVARVRKKMNILENRLEVGVRRECGFTALNATLREELKTLLDHRAYFNRSYTKLVQKLNTDKKYLLDLLEYAFNTYDGCININEKIMHTLQKNVKEREQAKVEMQGIMRYNAASELVSGFMNCKSQTRALADLQPIEYRRREIFRRNNLHKINLYNTVLEKIYDYTDSHNVEAVIDKYQQHESLYYTFFSYANETSFHITLLNNAVNRLYASVANTNIRNNNRTLTQLKRINELETKLEEQIQRNEVLNNKCAANEKRLSHLFHGITNIFNMLHVDPTPLTLLLGNHSYVDLHNARNYLKLLEKRILDIMMNVFILERDDPNKTSSSYIVRDIEKYRDYPTDLNDIVLTQQCPECAEGETFNIDDNGGVAVLSVEDAKKKLFEKVNQPEMQYRLHSISQCRLPRSRVLAARRNT